MKKQIIFLITTLSSLTSIANDGVFFARGNTLIPLEETKIALTKEVLTLEKQQGNLLKVSVYFEFNNPDTPSTRTVGFVTPPISGAIAGMDKNHPHISEFKVNVNNQSLNYKIARIDSTDFNSLNGRVRGDDFIYYFDVEFKKGLNIIKHSYFYKGNVVAHPFDPGPTYHYKLTTGKSWANGQIDNFEIRILSKESIFFSVQTRFNDNSNDKWQIEGNGKKSSSADDQELVKVKLVSGMLVYKANNFRPDYDLTIDILNPYSTLVGFREFYYPGIYSNPRNLEDLSSSNLRILRNSIFAVHGYKFQSKDLFDYFSKFLWYTPNKLIDANDIALNRWEKNLIDKIIKEENRRKNQ